MKRHYDVDDQAFPAEAYTVRGYRGVAFRVFGWETEPDGDTEWSGFEGRSGRVVARMIGDDRDFAFAPAEVTALDDLDYCASCGQIGCTHDGRERSEDAK